MQIVYCEIIINSGSFPLYLLEEGSFELVFYYEGGSFKFVFYYEGGSFELAFYYEGGSFKLVFYYEIGNVQKVFNKYCIYDIVHHLIRHFV
jgi:hypothetical protein